MHEHHVPYELQNAISEFMAAMDFIKPDVTVDKDGKFIIEVFDHSEYVDGHQKMVTLEKFIKKIDKNDYGDISGAYLIKSLNDVHR